MRKFFVVVILLFAFGCNGPDAEETRAADKVCKQAADDKISKDDIVKFVKEIDSVKEFQKRLDKFNEEIKGKEKLSKPSLLMGCMCYCYQLKQLSEEDKTEIYDLIKQQEKAAKNAKP